MYDEFPTMGSCGAQLGDVSILFYDEDSREFIQNTRHCEQGRGVRNPRNPRNHSFNAPYEPHNFASFGERRIWQSRSHDFLHWSEPVLVAACDEEDNLDESLYGMAQFRLGQMHLGTAGMLHKVDNEMDVHLLMSRDGIRWHRTAGRRPFLAPRGEDHWDAHMVSLASPPIPVGDELWFFHGGTNYHHDWFLVRHLGETIDHPEARNPDGARFCLGLATLRKEGFASLYANSLREGIVVTRPMRTKGDRLIINGRCAKGGSIRVEVANVMDEVVGCCSKGHCDPFTGDAVAHTVSWSGKSSIPAGASEDRDVRKLRFFLRDAEIFSFRFATTTG
jgi:hypothetical protein